MAFNQSTARASNVAFVNYSATLGMMYLATRENNASLEECKVFVGVEEWKKGFTGIEDADSTTAKARKFMAERNVFGGSVSGFISNIEVHKNGEGSQVNHYLRLRMNDLDGNVTNVSLDISNDGTQNLIRKLVCVHPDDFVEISVFAMLSKPNENGKRYGNHFSSVQAGHHPGALQKVSGIDPRDDLIPSQEAEINKLHQVGIKDAKLVNVARTNAGLNFHLKLVGELEARLLSHNADAQAAQEHA